MQHCHEEGSSKAVWMISQHLLLTQSWDALSTNIADTAVRRTSLYIFFCCVVSFKFRLGNSAMPRVTRKAADWLYTKKLEWSWLWPPLMKAPSDLAILAVVVASQRRHFAPQGYVITMAARALMPSVVSRIHFNPQAPLISVAAHHT